MTNNQSKAVKQDTPSGIHSVTPYLVCAGAAEAISFYQQAFDATEMIRLPGPDGKLMHACICLNGSSIMLTDENREYGMLSPRTLNGTPVTIHLVVDDVDAAFEKAVAAGATAVMPVADMFWGDRFGQIEDPFGHRWSIATPGRQMTEDELREAARAAMQP